MIVTDLSNSFYPYPKTKKEIKKGTSGIKHKRSKLTKLERDRYSILTKDLAKCYICNKKKKHIHEIYKGCNRQVSMKYGFCIPICDYCHLKTEIDMNLDKRLKQICQMEFEKTHTRDEFIALIKKSYL